MRVAVHVDQLWFSAPGGIGTYVRQLVPELSAAGADLTLFRSRSARRRGPDWLEAYPGAVVPGRIRTLYPRWDLTGRPAVAGVAAGRRRRARDEPCRGPARQRGPAPGRDGARPRVRTVPRTLFPARGAGCTARGSGRGRRRADAILVPSQAPPTTSRARGASTRRACTSRRSPRRCRRRRPTPARCSTGSDPSPVRAVRRHAGAAEEPRAAGARVSPARRGPAALVLAGPVGWRSDELRARSWRAGGPGVVVRTGALAAADLDALYRGADALRVSLAVRGVRAAGPRGDGAGRAGRARTRPSLPEVAGDAAVLVDPEDEVAARRRARAGARRRPTLRAERSGARAGTQADAVLLGSDGARYPRAPTARRRVGQAREGLADRHGEERRRPRRGVPRVPGRADACRPTRSSSSTAARPTARASGWPRPSGITADRGARRQHRPRPQPRDRRSRPRRHRRHRRRLRARARLAGAAARADRPGRRRLDGLLRRRSPTASSRSAWRP